MPFSHFTFDQILPLILSGCTIIASIIIFQRNARIGLFILFLGAIGMGYFFANLDPFLILWDEQYHALVAKNWANDFTAPVLIDDSPLALTHKDWTNCNVWLHKQPLFIWQMALSIKMFGTSALAVRLPSIIMHAIIPLFIYRIGKISLHKNIGFYAAVIFTCAYFPLELLAGRYSTDHNDVAFLFYLTAAFWSWFEYQSSQNKYWLILIGLFSGCAVLVKWLMGLLVYVVWCISIILVKPWKEWRKFPIIEFLISFAVSLLIFIPWQLYILTVYPIEAKYEMWLNAQHFSHVIENHSESTWFYFTDGLNLIYGSAALIPYLLLLGIVLMLINIKNRIFRAVITTTILFVYCFYTLAQTKMIAFPIIASPFIFLGLGYLISHSQLWIDQKLKKKELSHTIAALFLVVISFFCLNLNKVMLNHTDFNPNNNHKRQLELKEYHFIQSLDEKYEENNYIIFNANITYQGHIPFRFFRNISAFNYLPSKELIEELKEANKKIAVINLGNLPLYIEKDPQIEKLEI